MERSPEEKKRLRRQNIISAAILIFGIALSVFLFWPRQEEPEAPAEEPPVAVSTVIVSQAANGTSVLEKTAIFNSTEEADVVAEYTGRISEVRFEPGDEVKEGQILAVFDQSRLKNSPKVGLDSAQISFELAEDNLERTEEVAEEGVEIAEDSADLAKAELERARAGGNRDEIKIARERLDVAQNQEDQAEESAKLQVTSAKIQLEQARLQFEQARIAYQKTIIKAPISGTVTDKEIGPGSFLSSGQRVASISGNAELEAVIYLNSEEVSRIEKGDPVEIEISGQLFPGRIRSLSETPSADNRRSEVRVAAENLPDQFANSSARIKLSLSLNRAAGAKLFVPLRAVILGQRKNQVFVVEQNVARSREVEIGTVIGEQVEIISGLSAGEELIIDGSREVQDGQGVVHQTT